MGREGDTVDTADPTGDLSDHVAESVRHALALVGPSEGVHEQAGGDGDEAA